MHYYLIKRTSYEGEVEEEEKLELVSLENATMIRYASKHIDYLIY